MLLKITVLFFDVVHLLFQVHVTVHLQMERYGITSANIIVLQPKL